MFKTNMDVGQKNGSSLTRLLEIRTKVYTSFPLLSWKEKPFTHLVKDIKNPPFPVSSTHMWRQKREREGERGDGFKDLKIHYFWHRSENNLLLYSEEMENSHSHWVY